MSEFDFSFNLFGDDSESSREPAPAAASEDVSPVEDMASSTATPEPTEGSEGSDSDGPSDSGSVRADGEGNAFTRPTAPEVIRPEISDEDVERLFGEISEKARQDEDVLRNALSVLEAERILIAADAAEKKLHDDILNENARILELERELTAAKRRKAELSSQSWQKSLDKRRAEKDASDRKTAAKVAVEAVAIEEQAAVGYSAMIDRAKKYKWFTGISQGDKIVKAMDHQMLAISFMSSAKRCILGDKMGLGKTLSSIGTLDILDVKKTLIITPADITSNFQREIQFWTDHRPAINLRGQTRQMKQDMLKAIQILPVFTVVINYESWRRDPRLLTALASVGFDAVIMDEAHNMKNTSTDAFQGVKQIVHAMNKCPRDGSIMPQAPDMDTKIEAGRVCTKCGWAGESIHETSAEGSGLDNFADRFWLSRSVQYVFPMTGTAILNKPGDLFSLLNLIDPINFNRESSFLNSYAEWDYDKKIFKFSAGGMNNLMRRLSGKFLARSMADAGIVLPPQTPTTHVLTLENHPKQLQVIRQITENMQIALTEEKVTSITAIIAMYTRLRQANVWPGGITIKEPQFLPNGFPNPKAGEIMWRVADEVQESVKIDKAVNLIKEYTAQGDRIVVFSQFSTALQELNARVNGITNDAEDTIFSVVFDGSTPQSVREEIKKNFDRKLAEPKKWDVVMANYKTGGVGLNLTAATHVIVMDREWNPGKEEQALARVFRIGQTENTFVHVLEIEDTVDEWLNDIINTKADMIAGFDTGAADLKDALMAKMQKFLDGNK